MPTLPQQPLVRDTHGVVRFAPNILLCLLAELGELNMERVRALAQASERPAAQAEYAQLVQLLGYSIESWSDCPGVTPAMVAAVRAQPIAEGT